MTPAHGDAGRDDGWRGGCLCGAVRWQSAQRPVFQFNCHCTDCRKSTGAAMVPLMFFPTESLHIEGPLVSFASRGGSGGRIRRDFCGRCGAQVTGHVEMLPALLSIRAGTLDDIARYAPKANAFLADAPSWVAIDDRLPGFPGLPRPAASRGADGEPGPAS